MSDVRMCINRVSTNAATAVHQAALRAQDLAHLDHQSQADLQQQQQQQQQQQVHMQEIRQQGTRLKVLGAASTCVHPVSRSLGLMTTSHRLMTTSADQS